MGESGCTQVDQDVIEAIRSLGNTHRLQILLALDKIEQEHQQARYSMTFSELYEAVDIDSTSQFSYHLKQLLNQFITETPAGYRLTYSGNKIARVILSGIYESATTFEDTEVSGSCIFCKETALIATLEGELFRIRCTSCDAILVTDFIPQSQSRERTAVEITESFGYRIWSMFFQLRGGVCPECFGKVEKDIEVYTQNGKSHHIHVNTCKSCKYITKLPIEMAVAFHPAVIYWFWKQDLPLMDIPLWEFFGYLTSDVITTEVIAEDPFSANFEITLDQQTLNLGMEGTDSVVLKSQSRLHHS